MVCIPQVYATQEVTKWNDDSEFMVCIPQVYATQEVTKWNGDTVNLWFVYLRYMLPKRLQSEMIKQWVNGLYTSGICYPRSYKVKWWHSEFMVCIHQKYATQEVTKWNDYTVILWFVYLRYMLPKRLQSEMTTMSLWFVYPRYMLPKSLQSEMMTQWGFVYLSDPVYWFCELMLWSHNSLVNLDLRLFNFTTSHALQFDCYCCCHYYC